MLDQVCGGGSCNVYKSLVPWHIELKCNRLHDMIIRGAELETVIVSPFVIKNYHLMPLGMKEGL